MPSSGFLWILIFKKRFIQSFIIWMSEGPTRCNNKGTKRDNLRISLWNSRIKAKPMFITSFYSVRFSWFMTQFCLCFFIDFIRFLCRMFYYRIFWQKIYNLKHIYAWSHRKPKHQFTQYNVVYRICNTFCSAILCIWTLKTLNKIEH